MKHIDPHVHCRDGKEAYKTTIRKVLRLAQSQDIVAVIDMPNTDPPILTEKDVKERLRLVKKAYCSHAGRPKVKYFFYVGLTADEKQIQEAAAIVRNYPEAAGLKLYLAGPGHCPKVTRETDQENIFRILSESNYQGVLAEHCEKEGFFQPWLFDPQKPWTHGLARPPIAEIEAIRDQIRFAKKTKFKGNLHICHITLPESVELVWEVKKDLSITCGVTLHHILFTEDLLKEPNGLLYKANPPFREQESVWKLREQLFQGKIDWIETDHAVHAWEEKMNPPYLSGVTPMYLYRGFLFWLNQQGLIWPEIEKLTYWNIKRVFGEKLKEV